MFEDFESTGGGSVEGLRLYPKELMGHLLLIWAVDYIPHSPAKFTRPGDKADVIVIDLVDLDLADEHGQAVLVRKQWWRPGKLIRDLKPFVGRPNPILVRMSTEASGMGMNEAYVLVSMKGDPDAVRRGQAWLDMNPEFRPSESFPVAAQQQAYPQPVPREDPRPMAGQQLDAPRKETILERLARQAVEQQHRAANLPPEPPSGIPF